MEEWINFGDVNFSDHGGVMVKKVDYGYDFFQVKIDDIGNRYAFHGNIADLSDYIDEPCVIDAAEEFGYSNAADFVNNDPLRVVVCLVEDYGYGPLEFNARNHEHEGVYSLDITDFALSEYELANFMKEVEIPDKFIPSFEYTVESFYTDIINGTGTHQKGMTKTNEWSDVEKYSHYNLMNGYDVEITDGEYKVFINADRYKQTNDIRNGNFPVDYRDFEIIYGDEEEYGYE